MRLNCSHSRRLLHSVYCLWVITLFHKIFPAIPSSLNMPSATSASGALFEPQSTLYIYPGLYYSKSLIIVYLIILHLITQGSLPKIGYIDRRRIYLYQIVQRHSVTIFSFFGPTTRRYVRLPLSFLPHPHIMACVLL